MSFVSGFLQNEVGFFSFAPNARVRSLDDI